MGRKKKFRFGNAVKASFFTVLLLGLGVAVLAMAPGLSRQSVKRILAADHIHGSIEGVHYTYAGDPNQNAANLTEALRDVEKGIKPTPRTSTVPETIQTIDAELDKYKQSYALAEKIGDCQVYRPANASAQYLDWDTLDHCARLFATRSRSRSAHGDLPGAVQDLKRIVHIANFGAELPGFWAASINSSMVYRLVRTVVLNSPYFAHDQVQMAELKGLLSGLKQVHYEPMMEDAINEYSQGLTMATPGLKNWIHLLQQNTFYDRIIQESLWQPRFAEAMRQDLDDMRKDPDNPDNPALDMPHLVAAEKASGRANAGKHESADEILTTEAVAIPDEETSPEVLLEEEISEVTDIRKDINSQTARLQLTALALDAMAKGGLPQVAGTHDPFGSGPYRVVPLDKGWKLYSVGEDGIDQGGNDRISQKGLDGSDLVIWCTPENTEMRGR